ncbi:MAG: phosphoenolpyruvate-utilizing N-terminal domain-containing protein [Porcipelethomonas sp.]
MIVVKGKSASNGIAAGTIRFTSDDRPKIVKTFIDDAEKEKKRFRRAKADAANQLQGLYEKALYEIGEEEARIFSIHQMLLEDEDFINDVYYLIDSEKICAEYAVETVAARLYDTFLKIEDEYMSSRCSDVKDISDRVLRILCNKCSRSYDNETDIIICSDDLSPSEAMQINRKSVMAFVTRKGSLTSHAAILARKMSIPAIIETGSELLSCYSGCRAVVNAYTGEIYIDPDCRIIKRLTAEYV